MTERNWTALAGWARRLAWVGYWLLLLQQVADAWILGAPWIIWVFKLLPLLIFLPGLMGDRLRSYLWLCFVSLGYFVSLVERQFADPGSPLAAVGLVAVSLLFCSAMLYVRWRARQLKSAAGDEPA